MHRTLKQETTRPPQSTHRAQQREFDRFRQEYNEVRPHEALGQVAPTTLYLPSGREYPERLPLVDYPGNFDTRLVSSHGAIRWQTAQIQVTQALAGEYVGLEETADGIWSVYFGTALIGKLDARTGTVK